MRRRRGADAFFEHRRVHRTSTGGGSDILDDVRGDLAQARRSCCKAYTSNANCSKLQPPSFVKRRRERQQRQFLRGVERGTAGGDLFVVLSFGGGRPTYTTARAHANPPPPPRWDRAPALMGQAAHSVEFDEAKCYVAHICNPTCWLPMLGADIPAVCVAAQLDQTDRSHKKFDSTKGYPGEGPGVQTDGKNKRKGVVISLNDLRW
jgi:hypothetical protein